MTGKRIRCSGCCSLPLVLANVIFAAGTVFGQVGQNVSLPLFVTGLGESTHGKGGPYFVLFFASLAYTVIFFAWLWIRMLTTNAIGEYEKRYSKFSLFLIGLCDALNGVLVVFASPATRTAPFLQSVLTNFSIPTTIFFRWLILRRKETCGRVLCAVAVVGGLFLSLVPSIFHFDHNSKPTHSQGADGVAGVLWPICFMLGFVPSAIMNVLEERVLKSKEGDDAGKALGRGDSDDAVVALLSEGNHGDLHGRNYSSSISGAGPRRLDIIYFLAWTSLFQWVALAAFFFTDLIPGFGMAADIADFWKDFSGGFHCFFGGYACDGEAAGAGSTFIGCYVVAYLAGAQLIRYSAGATYSAIVQALVTPLGALFWTLFSEDPFRWDPEFLKTTWFAVGGLGLMLPGIFFYHYLDPGEEKEDATENQGLDIEASLNTNARLSLDYSLDSSHH